ncbi:MULTISPECIES: ACP S-malonyltransferase [unclassified Lysobacter]
MSDSRHSDQQLAFIFPGQGSQSPGMLGELARDHPLVTETFAEASAGAGVDLWALSQDESAQQLNQTEFTQPALLAAGVAVWRLWQSRGGARPAQLAGHSLGEYSALVAAGVLELGEAAGLVRLRGQLMQDAAPAGTGAMAAILGADDALVEQVCQSVSGKEVVVPANYNSPGQIVIGGDAAAVDKALVQLAERGVRKVVKLAVSVPSHTPLMRDAADHLAKAMDDIRWQPALLPVIHNVDAKVHEGGEAIRDALVRQLYLPVQWTGCMQALAERGARRFVECGPGKVLTGLVKRIDRTLEARSIGTAADFEATLADWKQ